MTLILLHLTLDFFVWRKHRPSSFTLDSMDSSIRMNLPTNPIYTYPSSATTRLYILDLQSLKWRHKPKFSRLLRHISWTITNGYNYIYIIYNKTQLPPIRFPPHLIPSPTNQLMKPLGLPNIFNAPSRLGSSTDCPVICCFATEYKASAGHSWNLVTPNEGKVGERSDSGPK